MMMMYFCLQTPSPSLKHTLFSAQRRLIKFIEQKILQQHWRLNHRVTDTYLTEHFATALEAKPQGYTNILNTIFC